MPIKNDKIPDLCARFANGDPAAARFLENIANIARLADDIADGDSLNPVGDMAELLTRVVVDNALNPFFQKHAEALTAVMANSIVLWRKSEDWRQSSNRKTRMFGFVSREAVEHVAYTVAFITGGFDHATRVAETIQLVSHQASEETFEDWEAE